MRNYLLIKYLITFLREYIFIFLTATIFLFNTTTESFSEENVFTISGVEVQGRIDLNFSRESYLNKAFIKSFKILMQKILLASDISKVGNVKIKKIKSLISSFKILEESYRNDEYRVKIKIFYNDNKIKVFLGEKNILFSEPENITAVFFPVLFINDEIQNLNENYFYRNWTQVEIKNELINFILPLEDLEDVSKIAEMKNQIEKLDVDSLVNKYNVDNYVFALMDHSNSRLNIHLKINFNNTKISKNLFFKLIDSNDELRLEVILKDLKIIITDLWKSQNLINFLLPLSIKIKFEHNSLEDLDKLRNALQKINIIDKFFLQEFNINSSFFEIYYYGNPKKLKSELFKFGYRLNNDPGFWQIY